MNKEILMVVDAVSNEKGVDKEIIFEALEAALASATRKKQGDAAEEWDVRVSINRKTGDYSTFRRWKVFADDSREMETPARELRLEDGLDMDPKAEIGGFVEEPMESILFGRIAAQQAKQVIVQKVREAERSQVIDAYKDRVGQLVSGIVKRIDRNGIYALEAAVELEHDLVVFQFHLGDLNQVAHAARGTVLLQRLGEFLLVGQLAGFQREGLLRARQQHFDGAVFRRHAAHDLDALLGRELARAQ